MMTRWLQPVAGAEQARSAPMAETTAGGHPDRASPKPDVLLRTKLHVPRSRPGLVARPRLADQLQEGLSRGLVLVAAPAGYGKSVLLSEWARVSGQPVAWLSRNGC
jgi:LuxR family maltose regulon positive regulatory protein